MAPVLTWPPLEGFVDALAGAIVGGILTGAAGFLGILYVRAKERDNEHTRFLAAVRVVLDELGANETNIAALTGQAFGRFEVYDSTYRGVELLLANYMRRDDRRLLAEAYAPARALWAAEEPTASPVDRVGLKNVGMIVPNQARLTAALEKIKDARRALAEYLPAGGY
jgi:hypothetical protein